jgi:hypothetical protein
MAQFFTRPNIEDRTMVQYSSMVINLSGTTAIANPGYLKINQGAAPGLVATSLDFDGTVVWGPVSGLSWSISACTSPLYVNNIVACPSSAGTIVVQSGILTVNGALQLNPTLSGGTAGDRLLVIDSNGYVKVGQTGTSISSLSYNNNNLTLILNDGSIFTATINTMTGLTINGNLTVSGNTRIVGNTSVIGNLNVTGNTSINGSVSATTYYGDGSNLTGIPDYYVTGGTFGGNVLTLNRQNGSVTIAGFTGFTDNFVTGGTYNYSTGTLTLNRQNGSLSVSGLSFTGNTLGTCITDIYVQNLYGCSNPITIGSSLKSSAGGSTAAGTSAFAFGNNVAATGNFSMAQGNGTSTAGGTYAHAEGANTTASGLGSHAEGLSTTSSGQYAHAEGRGAVASGNYSHAQGLFTNATTEGTFASGSGSTASGANSFIHSVGSTVSGNRSVVLGGFGINGTSNDFVYVPSLNINTTPTNNDSNAQILSRNSSTGNIEYTNLSLLTAYTDTFVTGFTYNNANRLTISRNGSQPDLTVSINNFTGLTVNGSLSATTYYGNGSNLTGIPDYYVTGGTYSAGTLTLNRQNGSLTIPNFPVPSAPNNSVQFNNNNTFSGSSVFTFNGNGLSLGSVSASTSQRLVLSNDVDNPDLWIQSQYNQRIIFNNSTTNRKWYISSDALPTGVNARDNFGIGTGSNAAVAIFQIHRAGSFSGLTSDRVLIQGEGSNQLGILRVNGQVQFPKYGEIPSIYSGTPRYYLAVNSSGDVITTNVTLGTVTADTFVTGFTYNNANTLTISRNGGQPDLSVNINRLTGLTVTNGLSADTLTLTTMAVTASTSTQALVRNTTTGVVESRPFGLESIILVTSASTIPIAGVGPSFDSIKGIPQGQVITGYTTIYSNNVSQSGPTVNTNFGTYDNTTGLFTTNVNATLMLNAYIHLKPDTSTSTAWSLSGTGEFGIGICPNNATDIYVGDYQTIIPDPDTAQYVYELYGANAPRTNQIDISISTVIYAASGSSFRVKVLNKTDRNYAGVQGDGIRFSITRIM